jgi:tetratricopeptide (TPR) repeat protein
LIFSGISLIINLKPRVINTGNITLDNDGKQLLFLIKVRSRYSDYLESITNFNNVEYEKAVPKLKNVLQRVPGDQNILRMLFNLLLQVKKIEDAFFYLSEFELRFGLSAHELLIKGCLLSALKNHEEAISTYRSVLKTDAVDLTALNNLGYELREKGELAEAEELLNKAITIDPEFDHAYGNLGFIKVLEGDLEAGKTLIDKSLALNNENAFAYKYLGTYYLKTGNLPLANFNFNKVKELDGTIDLDLRDDEVNALRKLYPENKSEIEHPKSEITPKSP